MQYVNDSVGGWRWLCLAAALLVLPGAASGFELITAEDVSLEASAIEQDATTAILPRMRSTGLMGPKVEIVTPDVGKPIHSPVNIALRWQTDEGASIDPSSLRVLYGLLKLDITARILAYAKVSATGLEATGAELPPGSHRLFVQVTDTAKRATQREVRLEIVNR